MSVCKNVCQLVVSCFFLCVIAPLSVFIRFAPTFALHYLHLAWVAQSLLFYLIFKSPSIALRFRLTLGCQLGE